MTQRARLQAPIGCLSRLGLVQRDTIRFHLGPVARHSLLRASTRLEKEEHQNGDDDWVRVPKLTHKTVAVDASWGQLNELAKHTIPDRSHFCEAAAEAGNLEALRWAKANGCEWGSDGSRNPYGSTTPFNPTSYSAAKGGHLEILQWASANGCSWNEETCEAAALGGHLEILQWLRENGCPWNLFTCCEAAAEGHLETVQWASANGCPLDEMTCEAAAGGGKLSTLQWLRENGCPWDRTRCLAAAADNGHTQVAQWIEAN